MEQVLRTITALNDAGFSGTPYLANNSTSPHNHPLCFINTEITMYETLIRPQEVTQVSLPNIETTVERLRKAEIDAGNRRLKQIETARLRNAAKRKRADVNKGSLVPEPVDGPSLNNLGIPAAKKRKQGNVIVDINSQETIDSEEGEVEASLRATSGPESSNRKLSMNEEPSSSGHSTLNSSLAHPFNEVRGHTSYLTFAVLSPYEHIASISVSIDGPTNLNKAPAPSGQNRSVACLTPQSHPPQASFPATVTDTTEEFGEYDDFFRSIPDAVCPPALSLPPMLEE
jgi:tRNA (adenine57-N1/adenine58-N1)-methyltransferase